MPIHDWTRVDDGIFHAFHHDWITEIARALNRGLLPAAHYALPEQYAAGFGPDVLAPQEEGDDAAGKTPARSGSGGVGLATPQLQPTAESDAAYYRRKQKAVAVRHVSGDRIVAMIELVSPGNKASRHALRAFVDKACELLERGVHLLIVDLHPPGPRDPQGMHGAVWGAFAGPEYAAPTERPLTLAAYECALTVRAYVRRVAVGEPLPEMPLFLEPGQAVMVPLEASYQVTFTEVPRRWRRVLEASSS